jgi:hypothetical protein
MTSPTSRSLPFDPVKRLEEILNGCRDQGGTISRANEEFAVRQLAQELIAAASETRAICSQCRRVVVNGVPTNEDPPSLR